MGGTVQRPTIFVIALDNQPFFDDMYSKLTARLFARARVQRAKTRDGALRHLSSNAPSAILVTDPGVMQRENTEVLEQIKTYVAKGGTVVFGCLFSTFITAPNMNKIWQSTFDLPWQFGGYYRTTVQLKDTVARTLKFSPETLHLAYSQKAVFLKNVDANDALCLPSSSSMTQSHVFQPKSVDQNQAPMVRARSENGWIWYVGDVSAEIESNEVYLAMCGL